ncbi:MAG: CoA pyrophosphatase [Candidatus Vecturithrix sp.]|nr:CoA pyrophosphatase [Candidatus Vecturithrix sp.]
MKNPFLMDKEIIDPYETMNRHDIERLRSQLPACPGILARDRFFNSAVLIPLVLKNDEVSVLFQKRANHIRQGGEICFPGGQYDPELDADYQETAVRETIEELGVKREQIQILGRLGTFLAPQGVTIEPFVGILHIENVDELLIDPNEVEGVFLLPMTYFENTLPQEYHVRVEVQPAYINEKGEEQILLPVKALGLPECYARPWGGRHYRVLVYPSPEDTIWGMTAAIIYDLVQKLHV